MANIDNHLKNLINNLKVGDSVPVPPHPRSEKEIIANWSGDRDKPLVSIVCFTYNHVNFVKEALNGFLMQKTDFPFEIIVHDDASSDGTVSVLREYGSRFPRLIKLLIQEENQYKKGLGPVSFAFPSARGKYIALCEGDDYWIDEEKISKQASFLEEHSDVAIVYTNALSFSGINLVERNSIGSKVDLTAEELKRAPSIFTLTACFRNILDNPIELNFSPYGDKFTWSRLGKFGKGKYMKDILPSFYRVHSGGIHSSTSEEEKSKMILKTVVAMSSYYKRIGDSELEEYFMKKALVIAIIASNISPKLLPVMKVLTKIMRKLK